MSKGNAIAMLELGRVSTGILAMDAMLKAAEVRVLTSGPVCPGKFFLVVRGDISSVNAAVDAVAGLCEGLTYDRFVTANIHEDVFRAVMGLGPRPKEGQSIGLIETFSASSAISAADSAVKAADVRLADIRLAKGLGGRAYIVMSGDVGAVDAAVKTGARISAEEGMLVGSLVLARPHSDLLPLL